ncbi:unnamed protein product [Gongylonema pulchrum]|uniref:Ovule protein n=1 Tax=Gongylonema pulchrum TaxID=637853 RepID=A0A183EPP5_9BILA|nr:unnamed protein product [Gongylonema pulchrum]
MRRRIGRTAESVIVSRNCGKYLCDVASHHLAYLLLLLFLFSKRMALSEDPSSLLKYICGPQSTLFS